MKPHDLPKSFITARKFFLLKKKTRILHFNEYLVFDFSQSYSPTAFEVTSVVSHRNGYKSHLKMYVLFKAQNHFQNQR